MAVYTFVINAGFGKERAVKATTFQTVGDFVDFTDDDGIVLRVRANSVTTVDRQD